MHDVNGHEIILNDQVAVKHKGKLVAGRVLRISQTHPKVKICVNQEFSKWFHPLDVQVLLHWH
ncbi:MAG: hypothetical protein AMJ53_18570 [Gammaproteobacteria bacterium SG8_11]|nr:MAG: hypothetical protein AMJ53_18570 [Gammaproteobacteria bacterium SG8_11]